MHRRILIAVLLASAACGGKKTITATADIKAQATEAQQGLGDTSTGTQATIGLQSISQNIGEAVIAGSVDGVDLSGLPAPETMASAAAAAPRATTSQALRAAGSSAVTSATNGCLARDGAGTPKLIAAGTLGCGAFDHLEVDYDNNDVVNLAYSATATSFDLTVTVVQGRWTGTELHYSGTWDSASSSNVTVSANGALMYLSDARQIDSDFSVSYHLSASQIANGESVTVSVNGTATDHVALIKATEGWTMTAQNTTSGSTSQAILDWNGSVEIDLLKADGVSVFHSVRFDGLNVHCVGTGGTGTSSLTYSAGGDVEWDGAVVGSVVASGLVLYVNWTDGTQTPFNGTALVGSI